MIRHRWETQVKGGRLAEEIKAIKGKVTPEVWNAIDTVRSVGNIGAHMEQDVNVIVDIDENEAERLLGLIECLLQDWYVAPHQQRLMLAELKALGAEKEQARKEAKAESARDQPAARTAEVKANEGPE